MNIYFTDRVYFDRSDRNQIAALCKNKTTKSVLINKLFFYKKKPTIAGLFDVTV